MIDSPSEAETIKPRSLKDSALRGLGRGGIFLGSTALFMLALVLVKDGVRPLAPLLRSSFSIESPVSALGFGWLFSTVILSGSPVAATALTFLDSGVLSRTEAFAMVAGSRLGAAFIVLLVGFIYVLRGEQREGSLSAGLLSLLVTQIVYMPSMLVGYYMLTHGTLASIQIGSGASMASPLDRLFKPVLATAQGAFSPWMLVSGGFAAMLVSFWLFDRALPDFGLAETSLGRVNRLLYRPIVTFALGAGVTAVTLSVSVSLSLLVPLSARGYIRQENMIPYIMGANITTFIDTVFAAALLANPAAVTVVLVHMVSVGLVSFIILVLGFRSFEQTVVQLVRWIEASRVNVVGYLALSLLVPLLLVILF